MKRFLLFCAFVAIGVSANAQDRIMLRNNGEILGTVLSINPVEVEYQRRDNPDSSICVLPASDILYIEYANGIRRTFDNSRDIPKTDPRLGQTKDRKDTPSVRNNRPYYHGEVAIAYGFTLGAAGKSTFTNGIVAETIHGVRINDFYFTGIGAGYTYLYNTNTNEGLGLVPLFSSNKGYFIRSDWFSYYISMDIGTAFTVSGARTRANPYLAGGGGAVFTNRANKSCDLGIRYQFIDSDMSVIMIRVGIGF